MLVIHRSLDAVSFLFSSRRRHTRSKRDWSSDVCSSDLFGIGWIRFIGDKYSQEWNHASRGQWPAPGTPLDEEDSAVCPRRHFTGRGTAQESFSKQPLFRCGAPKLLPTAFLRESVARRRSSFTGLPGKPWKDPWVLWRVASADAYARAPDPGGRLQPVHGGSLRQESSSSR